MRRGPSGAVHVAWCKPVGELRLVPFAAVARPAAEGSAKLKRDLAAGAAANNWSARLAGDTAGAIRGMQHG